MRGGGGLGSTNLHLMDLPRLERRPSFQEALALLQRQTAVADVTHLKGRGGGGYSGVISSKHS